MSDMEAVANGRGFAMLSWSENSGKQRKTANLFAVLSLSKSSAAQDFRGGRDVVRC
jgi:hypothetical protein